MSVCTGNRIRTDMVQVFTLNRNKNISVSIHHTENSVILKDTIGLFSGVDFSFKAASTRRTKLFVYRT